MEPQGGNRCILGPYLCVHVSRKHIVQLKVHLWDFIVDLARAHMLKPILNEIRHPPAINIIILFNDIQAHPF